jgi:hypothetical protein
LTLRGRWRWYVPLKRQSTFVGLHSVISQKKSLLVIKIANNGNKGSVPNMGTMFEKRKRATNKLLDVKG